MSWKHWYRVDTVPNRWWPFYLPVSFAGAAALFLYARLARSTCRTEICGREHLAGRPRYIWALWHEHLWLSWVVLGDWRGQGWLNHPLLVHASDSLGGVLGRRENVVLGP